MSPGNSAWPFGCPSPPCSPGCSAPCAIPCSAPGCWAPSGSSCAGNTPGSRPSMLAGVMITSLLTLLRARVRRSSTRTRKRTNSPGRSTSGTAVPVTRTTVSPGTCIVQRSSVGVSTRISPGRTPTTVPDSCTAVSLKSRGPGPGAGAGWGGAGRGGWARIDGAPSMRPTTAATARSTGPTGRHRGEVRGPRALRTCGRIATPIPCPEAGGRGWSEAKPREVVRLQVLANRTSASPAERQLATTACCAASCRVPGSRLARVAPWLEPTEPNMANSLFGRG